MTYAHIAILLASCVQGQAGGETYQDFRSQELPQANFIMPAPEQAKWIKPETAGLRITLPADQRRPEPVGITLGFPTKGDFEITVSYELIDVPRPTAGFGSGFELYVKTNGPAQDAIGYYRFTRPSGLMAYGCARLTTFPDGRRGIPPGVDSSDKPATGTSGKLRITRSGSTAVLSAAEGSSSDFDEKFRMELGSDDVAMVRLAANPGNASNPVDMRLIDFRVGPISRDAGSSLAAQSMDWWWIALLVVLALTIAGGIIWWRKKRSRTAEPRAQFLQDVVVAVSEGYIVWHCPTCGKHLKAKAELAGKKVKCAQCGNPVEVPEESLE